MPARPPLPQHNFSVTFYPPSAGPIVLGFTRVTEIHSTARADEYNEVTSPETLTSPAGISFQPVTFTRGVCTEDDYQTLLSWHFAPKKSEPFVGEVNVETRGKKTSGVSQQVYSITLTGWISEISIGGWDAATSGVLLSSLVFSPWRGDFINS